jgi:PKHD-type hydroxylase
MLLQIPGVLSPGELESLRGELRGASFDDGAATAGSMARNVKRNLQLAADSPIAKKCAAVVLDALRRSPVFFSAALPHRIQGPAFNRYDPGMTYGDHVDNALMGTPAPLRSDVAATLFLSEPKDYDGGELVVHDRFGAHRVKLAAGSIVVYPASSTHRVEPIHRGSRLAAVLWIQSLVRDAARRQALFELDFTIGALREKAPAVAGEITALTALYHNLLRMWAET